MSTTTGNPLTVTPLTEAAIASFAEFAAEHVGQGITLEACLEKWRQLQAATSLTETAKEAHSDFRSGRTVSSTEFHNQLQSLIASYDREANPRA